VNSVFLIEYLIFVGAVLVWACVELWSVRRSKWNDAPGDKKETDSERTSRHTER
jgi:uncharacterized membrane protein